MFPAQKWRIKTKENLITAMGGKCCRCGYDRTKNALHFHHLDPKVKDHTIANLLKNPRKIDLIIAEAQKCILLCANCHAEFHDNLWTIDSIVVPIFDMTVFELLKKRDMPSKPCLFCSTPTINDKYCSKSCASKGKLTHQKTKAVWPSLEELTTLIDRIGYVGVGKLLGVSDTAVKKHYNKRVAVESNDSLFV